MGAMEREIHRLTESRGLVMEDAIVATVTPLTIVMAGSTVAVPAVAVAGVLVGDKVQVLKQGAAAPVVLGAIGGRRHTGRTEITTTTNGTFTITFPADFPSTNYRVLAIAEANAVTGTAYVVTVNSRAAGSVQLRLLDQNGNVGTGVTRIIHWDAEWLG